jgi:2-polyprenyl-6-methoxyphenol hydroxylase-like FAD-dependent oxidoreductase
MNVLKDKKVAIVGGGPGGLTLARLLQQKGVTVNVYERDENKHIRQQGATLDLHHDSGLAALGAANLLEEFTQCYRPGADKIRIVNGQGEIFYSEHEHSNKPVLDFNSPYSRPEIDRGPLRDMLIDSLAEGTVIWDCKFTEMKPCEDGWELFFENGNSAYADLVVAADGGNSKVRTYVTGIKPIYSGCTIVEGNVYNAKENAPKLWKLTQGGKVFVLGNGKTLWLSAKGDGTLNAYTTTPETEDWVKTSGIDFNDIAQVKEWFTSRYEGWDEQWLEIFEHEDTHFIPRPQYHFPEDQSWETQSNVTLLGDAAHRTPPSGEGVNQAMLDALVLTNALTNGQFDTLHDALTHYEKDMLIRGKASTIEALEFSEMIQREDALEKMLEFFADPIA